MDVNSDQQDKGLGIEVAIDRDRAAALGISPVGIDNTLYDAFGQRQVSTIYQPLNQYNVVMEVAPEYWHKPETLDAMFVSTSGFAPSGVQSTNAPSGTVSRSMFKTQPGLTPAALNDPARNASLDDLATHGRGRASAGAAISTAAETMVPLAAFAHFEYGKGSLSVHHQGLLPAVTISFNLAPDTTLNEALRVIEKTRTRIGLPQAVHGHFLGRGADVPGLTRS